MCPLAGWSSSGTGEVTDAPTSLPGVSIIPAAPPRSDLRRAAAQAMNMRAAEAIVSSAPKPMKILPISEV